MKRDGRTAAMAALGGGVVVGVAVGVLSSALFSREWGVTNGVLAWLAASGLALTIASHGLGRRVGAAVLSLVSGFLASASWWWIVSLDVPLSMTVGDLWLWGLAAASTVVAVVAGRRTFTGRR